jgi:hypothetical protein
VKNVRVMEEARMMATKNTADFQKRTGLQCGFMGIKPKPATTEAMPPTVGGRSIAPVPPFMLVSGGYKRHGFEKPTGVWYPLAPGTKPAADEIRLITFRDATNHVWTAWRRSNEI